MSDQAPQDVAAQVMAGFEELRRSLQARSVAFAGDENLPVRRQLLEVLFELDAWRDQTLATLVVPALAASSRMALSENPPPEWPLRSPQVLSALAANSAGRHLEPRAGHHRRVS